MKMILQMIAVLGLFGSSTALAQNYHVEGGLPNCESCQGNKAIVLEPPLRFDLNVPMKWERPKNNDDADFLPPRALAQSRRRGQITDCSAHDVMEGDLGCASRLTGKGVLIDHDDPCWSVKAKGAKEIQFTSSCGLGGLF